jgi:hypothetical protein
MIQFWGVSGGIEPESSPHTVEQHKAKTSNKLITILLVLIAIFTSIHPLSRHPQPIKKPVHTSRERTGLYLAPPSVIGSRTTYSRTSSGKNRQQPFFLPAYSSAGGTMPPPVILPITISIFSLFYQIFNIKSRFLS